MVVTTVECIVSFALLLKHYLVETFIQQCKAKHNFVIMIETKILFVRWIGSYAINIAS